MPFYQFFALISTKTSLFLCEGSAGRNCKKELWTFDFLSPVRKRGDRSLNKPLTNLYQTYDNSQAVGI